MAVLVALGGAALGSVFGATNVGWIVGSVIGGLLFPSKDKSPGPQIQDLSITSSAWGTVIPRGYGAVRISGNRIWAYGNKMQTHTESEGGGSILGKGGGGATTTKYTCSFADSFGWGPCKDILKIWADGKVIFDKTTTNVRRMPGLNFRVYKGHEDQLPDSLIERDRGTGNVPGYRGQIIIRFIDLPLDNFGNHPPSIAALVAYEAETAQPITPASSIAGAGEMNFAIDWSRRKVYTLDHDTQLFGIYDVDSMVQERTVSYADVGAHDYGVTGGTGTGQLAVGPNGQLYAIYQIGLFGDAGIAKIDPAIMMETATLGGVAYAREIAFGQVHGPTATRTFAVTFASNNIFSPKQVTVLDADTMEYVWSAATATNYYAGCMGKVSSTAADVWAFADGTHLHKITIDGAAYYDAGTSASVGVLDNLAYTLVAGDVISGASGLNFEAMAYDDTDDTLMLLLSTSNKGSFAMKWSQAAGVLFCVKVPKGIETAASWGPNHWGRSRISSGFLAYVAGSGSDHVIKVDTATGETTDTQWPIQNVGAFYGGLQIYDGESDSIVCWNKTGLNIHGNAHPTGLVRIWLDRGDGLGRDLAEIVTAECGLVGLEPADLDVSELSGTLVDGYFVGRPGAEKDNLAPLNQAFFFDAVEEDWKLKFFLRPKASSVTIPEDDLAEVDDKSGETVKPIRQQDLELPARAQVTFFNRQHDYQQDSKSSPRVREPLPAMSANGTLGATFPIAMTGAAGRQIAEKLLWTAWFEREGKGIKLPWSYLRLSPADVVTLDWDNGDSDVLRISKRDLGLDYSIEMEGMIQGTSTYASDASTEDQWTPPAGPGDASTKLIVLDIPLLRDLDSAGQTGSIVYWAAGPYTRNAWAGCSLMRSTDPATGFSAVGASTDAMSWGSVATALPDNLEPWGWDTTTTLTVAQIGGPDVFQSASDDEVLAGANALAIIRADGEAEVVCFANASQNADGTWALTRLLRGRRGTDVFCSGHAIGDTFVFLSATSIKAIRIPPSERGSSRYWKGVAAGQLTQDADTVTKVTNARDLMPYNPSHAAAASTGGGSPDIDLTWVRRTRLGGEWTDGVDAPLSETSEAYEVEIYSGPAGTLKRTLTGLTSAAATYSNANIVTDFGSLPATLTLKIYQLSGAVGRGLSRETTIPVT